MPLHLHLQRSYLLKLQTHTNPGAKKMNPKLTLHVVWVMTWYDPCKEADAAKALTPSVVMLLHNTQTLSPSADCRSTRTCWFWTSKDQSFCSQAQLTATIDNWGPHYIAKVGAVLDGTWTTPLRSVEGCYFGHMNDGLY